MRLTICGHNLQDEPTSHLDMKSIECLQTCLQGYSGGLVLVTHDQHFCDSVAEKVLLFCSPFPAMHTLGQIYQFSLARCLDRVNAQNQGHMRISIIPLIERQCPKGDPSTVAWPLVQVYLVQDRSLKLLEHGVKDYVRQLKKRRGLRASS